jgi:hypothetical protein
MARIVLVQIMPFHAEARDSVNVRGSLENLD